MAESLTIRRAEGIWARIGSRKFALAGLALFAWHWLTGHALDVEQIEPGKAEVLKWAFGALGLLGFGYCLGQGIADIGHQKLTVEHSPPVPVPSPPEEPPMR